jgi:stage V sporulation protein G
VEITEIRIKLMEDAQERLLAFCSLTFDHAFVIRDLKIIEGTKGCFVAMPSRKLTDRCGQCGCKNQLRAAFCNQCGAHLKEERAPKDADGRAKLYADIAHPINTRCREMIQAKVVQAYEEELIRAQQPGYVSRYDDFGEDSIAEVEFYEARVAEESRSIRAPDGQSRRVDTSAQAPASAPHAFSDRPAIREGFVDARGGSDPFSDGIL